MKQKIKILFVMTFILSLSFVVQAQTWNIEECSKLANYIHENGEQDILGQSEIVMSNGRITAIKDEVLGINMGNLSAWIFYKESVHFKGNMFGGKYVFRYSMKDQLLQVVEIQALITSLLNKKPKNLEQMFFMGKDSLTVSLVKLLRDIDSIQTNYKNIDIVNYAGHYYYVSMISKSFIGRNIVIEMTLSDGKITKKQTLIFNKYKLASEGIYENSEGKKKRVTEENITMFLMAFPH